MKRDAPPYMHRLGGRSLYAQIKLNDGKYLSRPLDTHDPAVARARILPIIDELIAAEKLDPEARICRIYARGKCPTCGRRLEAGNRNAGV